MGEKKTTIGKKGILCKLFTGRLFGQCAKTIAEHTGYSFCFLCFIIFLVWLLVFFHLQNWSVYCGPFSAMSPSELGDAFGTLNTMFSGLAFAGAIVAVMYQAKAFKAQKEELHQQIKEVRLTNETAQLQRFENTFFAMTRALREIGSEISFGIGDDVKQGREAFKFASTDFIREFLMKIEKRFPKQSVSGKKDEYFATKPLGLSGQDIKYLDLTDELLSNLSHNDNEFRQGGTDEDGKFFFELPQSAYNKIKSPSEDNLVAFLGGLLPSKQKFIVKSAYSTYSHTNCFDHYFRMLYRILHFIRHTEKETPTFKKTPVNEYTGILRAQLSSYELVMIYYNGLIYHENGEYRMKALIEKYGILNNLRLDLPGVCIEKSFYQDSAFG